MALEQREFSRRVLIVVGIVVLAAVLLHSLRLIWNVLLVFFAGCLLGVFLDGATRTVRDWTRLPRGWALATVCLVIVLLTLLAAGIAGVQIADQFSELGSRLPRALEQLRERVLASSWMQSLLQSLPDAAKQVDGAQIFGRLTDLFTLVMGGLGTVVIIVFIGLYLAISPKAYTGIVVSLLPAARRPRGEQVFELLGRALRRWLLARLASMFAIGVLTWMVLAFIGLPLALPLGMIAGLLSFIPYLGPLLAAVPAVLIGFSESPAVAGYVVLGYAVVQAVESYLITPLIERHAVLIPPAFQLTAALVAGVLAGFMGMLLASPLVVVATVLVQLLYLEDVLGDSPRIVGDS